LGFKVAWVHGRTCSKSLSLKESSEQERRRNTKEADKSGKYCRINCCQPRLEYQIHTMFKARADYFEHFSSLVDTKLHLIGIIRAVPTAKFTTRLHEPRWRWWLKPLKPRLYVVWLFQSPAFERCGYFCYVTSKAEPPAHSHSQGLSIEEIFSQQILVSIDKLRRSTM
jgi:hypothetical protein